MILWTFTLTVGSLLVYRGLVALFPGLTPLAPGLDTAMKLGAIGYPVFIAWVLAYFGDVPRYTRAAPSNIAARKAIRERGLALLKAIEAQGGYGRIVLVGHSLGSILAYDLLKLLWSEREMIRTMRVGDARYQAVEAFQAAAERLPAGNVQPAELDAYREAQFAVFKALKGATSADRPGWPISDLITVGSPLTHAQFLLEKDARALAGGIAERRFPTNPPFMSKGEPLIYDLPSGTGAVRLHHAAPFAATRWTNIYDPPTVILLGDCISGPVSEVLGRGTRDVPVTMRGPWRGRLFTHTLYWTDTGRGVSHLLKLREALNLGRAFPWTTGTDAPPNGTPQHRDEIARQG